MNENGKLNDAAVALHSGVDSTTSISANKDESIMKSTAEMKLDVTTPVHIALPDDPGHPDSTANGENGESPLTPTSARRLRYGGGPMVHMANHRPRKSSLVSPGSVREIQKLTSLRRVNTAAEREQLVAEKLRQCHVLFDFVDDPLSDLQYKEVKRENLNEITEYLREGGRLTDALYPEFIAMFCANVFRPFAPPSNPVGVELDPDEDEVALEPSWPHLQLVYDVLLRLLESPCFTPKPAERLINESFVTNLINLLNCEDPRERDCLKVIVHRVYGRFPKLRTYMRHCMSNILFSFIYESEEFHGVAEILNIMSTIIKGFNVPLREEHKAFLLRVLMPLHKTKSLPIFHEPLVVCIVDYLEKDPTLMKPVFLSLLKFWPKTHTMKEVMFLCEIEEYLEGMSKDEFNTISVPLFKKLAACVISPHCQVAEKALYFFNNGHFVHLMAPSIEVLAPIVFPPLYRNSRGKQRHWNKTVDGLMYNAVKQLMEINQRVMDQLVQRLEVEMSEKAASLEERRRYWEEVERRARANPNWHAMQETAFDLVSKDDRHDISRKSDESLNRSIADPFREKMTDVPPDEETERALSEYCPPDPKLGRLEDFY